jgi:hypothetical protein
MSSRKTERRKERTKRDVFLRPSSVRKLVMREEKQKGHNNKLLLAYMKLPLALETESTSCPKFSQKQT